MTNSGYWIERKSARGYPYRVWRWGPKPLMPAIPQYYLDCSIYLYPSRASAEAGERFGGSGCLVSIKSPPILETTPYTFPPSRRYTKVLVDFPAHVYAVTNMHVIREGCSVVRLNTIDDRHDILELGPHDWKAHPDGDDLAVATLDMLHERHDYFAIPTQQFVNRDSLGSSIGAGDDTFMVGRFVTHAGSQRNTPSLRFGNIAMLPFEKIKLGRSANNHMQEAFLVESRSISGYSGSPVFVYGPTETETRIPPDYYDSYEARDTYVTSITDLVGNLAFLGIDCGHAPDIRKVVNSQGIPHPDWRIDINTGMAIVIPAWRLMDLLNRPEFEMQRKERDEKYKRDKEQEETVSLDVERPEAFTKESYQDVLKRVSRKISESEDPKTSK